MTILNVEPGSYASATSGCASVGELSTSSLGGSFGSKSGLVHIARISPFAGPSPRCARLWRR